MKPSIINAFVKEAAKKRRKRTYTGYVSETALQNPIKTRAAIGAVAAPVSYTTYAALAKPRGFKSVTPRMMLAGVAAGAVSGAVIGIPPALREKGRRRKKIKVEFTRR